MLLKHVPKAIEKDNAFDAIPKPFCHDLNSSDIKYACHSFLEQLIKDYYQGDKKGVHPIRIRSTMADIGLQVLHMTYGYDVDLFIDKYTEDIWSKNEEEEE